MKFRFGVCAISSVRRLVPVDGGNVEARVVQWLVHVLDFEAVEDGEDTTGFVEVVMY